MIWLNKNMVERVNERLDSMFSDSQEIRVILATLPLWEKSRFYRFIDGINSVHPMVYYFLNSKEGCPRGGETILRLLSISRKLTSNGWKDPDFVLGCYRIAQSDSIDDFEALDQDVQNKTWSVYFKNRMFPHYHACSDKAYLKLLRATGAPAVDEEKLYGGVNEYIRLINQAYDEKRKSKKKIAIELDLSDVSEEFLTSTYGRLSGPYWIWHGTEKRSILRAHQHEIQVLTLLRAVYGEKSILEVLEVFNSEDKKLCIEEFVDLVGSWDEMKEYPASWIRHVKDFKH